MKLFKNYRHIICLSVTVLLVTLGVFVFNGSAWRLWESLCDFFSSLAYWFLGCFGFYDVFAPTSIELPTLPLWHEVFPTNVPIIFLPETWEMFAEWLERYWEIFFNFRVVLDYVFFLLELVLYTVSYLYNFILLFLVGYLLFWLYVRAQNNDDDVESEALKRFKSFQDTVLSAIRRFFVELFVFVRIHKAYWIIWGVLTLIYVGAASIVLSVLAYLFYWSTSLDLFNLYVLLYKVVYDLAMFFETVPLVITLALVITVNELNCRRIAYNGLYHRERCNRGFVNERGVVTIVWGEMGVGKTALITDCMLSAEVQLRDDAYEVILETDMKFPNFTWATFERQLRQAIYFHVIYDVWSCRRWIRKKRELWEKSNCRERIFGYDYERYGLTYDDKLKLVNVWSALEDYACAYLIYTVQSSLIVANYSIRVDSLLYDLGNFPLWNCDFFKRDSRLLDSFSRHCKILDFDMLRLGRIMLENNPNRNAYGFGVWGVTELDKERKNTPELKDVKADADECNQRNDLFNVLLKMSRHACVIANRVFVKVFADLQRPESLGADCRELGEVTYIEDKSQLEPVLPFFSLYHIFEVVIDWAFQPFRSIYAQYRVNRSDNTLPLYLFKNFESRLQHIKERTRNVFGAQALTLELQSGRMNGEPKKRKWYRMPKKIYSRRYTTDCQQAIFERRAVNNFVGIDDFREYADDMANGEELIYQNSHMQVELLRCVA